jgi:hypothetical protein
MKLLALAGVAGLLVVALLGAARARSAPPNSDVLPDLVQALPSALTLTEEGGRFRLGFASAVSNVGAGPLVVVGERASTRTAVMRGRQLIERELGGWRRTLPVGELRYVVAETHQHWHLLPFDDYELRRGDGTGQVVRAFKSGFCLGDRYRERRVAPLEAAAAPYYTSDCGRGDRGVLSLRQGISTGYGDIYLPNLEGQWLDVTGLPAGEYVLAHVVNAGRRLRESDYGNNAASLRIRLSWPAGPAAPPAVATLASCPGSRDC